MKNKFSFVILSVVVVSLLLLSLKSPTLPSVLPIEVESTVLPEETIFYPEETKKVKIKHLDLTKERVTHLNSEVNSLSIDNIIADITKFNTKKGDIYLLIDSPGGSVIDGAKLISVIQSSPNPIYCINMGMAASMAFMILEHCTKRYALDRSILMAHGASVGVHYQGKLDELVSRYTFLKRFVDKMDRYVADRAGIPYTFFKLKSNAENWVDAQDGLAFNYLDNIVSVKLPASTTFTSGENKLKNEIRME